MHGPSRGLPTGLLGFDIVLGHAKSINTHLFTARHLGIDHERVPRACRPFDTAQLANQPRLPFEARLHIVTTAPPTVIVTTVLSSITTTATGGSPKT